MSTFSFYKRKSASLLNPFSLEKKRSCPEPLFFRKEKVLHPQKKQFSAYISSVCTDFSALAEKDVPQKKTYIAIIKQSVLRRFSTFKLKRCATS